MLLFIFILSTLKNRLNLNSENENIYSAASCTTNAISPVLKVVHEKLGIVKGHIETVHAYTNDQNLLDNMHKSSRRGRSAAINMVITSTGAGAAARGPEGSSNQSPPAG